MKTSACDEPGEEILVVVGKARVPLSELRSAALRLALRVGMKREDAQDCASDWVARVLCRQSASAMPEGAALSGEEARRYAEASTLHFVLRRITALARLHRREAALDDLNSDETGLVRGDVARDTQNTCGSSAESGVIQKEQQRSLRRELITVIAILPPAQRDVVVRHHLQEESLRQIAEATGLSEDAVKQTSYRARRTLKRRLEQRGFTLDEMA